MSPPPPPSAGALLLTLRFETAVCHALIGTLRTCLTHFKCALADWRERTPHVRVGAAGEIFLQPVRPAAAVRHADVAYE